MSVSLPAARNRLVVAAAATAALLGAILVLPALADVPRDLAGSCARWIALGAVLEVLSAAGFVLSFALAFGSGARRALHPRVGLRALALSTALPAGPLVGPAVGGWMMGGRRERVAPRALAFLLLTNLPDLAALGALGLALRMHLLAGPHALALTLGPVLAAVLVGGAIASLPLWPRARPSRSRGPLRRRLARAGGDLRDGVARTGALLDPRDWRVLGPVAYFACDAAVLWVAFRALGHSPPVAVIGMAYVIGQAGAVLPLPGGVGGVDLGLVGALVLYGTAAGPATAAVLVYRAISLAVPLALGACAGVRLRTPSQARASGPSSPSYSHPDIPTTGAPR